MREHNKARTLPVCFGVLALAIERLREETGARFLRLLLIGLVPLLL